MLVSFPQLSLRPPRRCGDVEFAPFATTVVAPGGHYQFHGNDIKMAGARVLDFSLNNGTLLFSLPLPLLTSR